MQRYTRVVLAEREEVSRQLAAGQSLRSIARTVGRAPSSLSREVRRRGGSRITYRAEAAPHEAEASAHQARRPRKLLASPRRWTDVHTQMAQRWSPEQMAPRLVAESPDDRALRVSHERIDASRYVLPRGELKRALLRYLRPRHRRRNRQGATQDRRGRIPNMISSEARPAEVADRTIPGPWEGDWVMGGRTASALGTWVARTSRTTRRVPLRTNDATRVRRACARTIRTRPTPLVRSLTDDQGRDMSAHALFTQETRVRVFFAHPHSPWERGTTENTTGLIRQCFPQGTDCSNVSRREITHGQALLHGRPRQVLNWRTPSEVFHDHRVALAT